MPLVDSNSASLWDGSSTSLYRYQQGELVFGYTRPAMSQYIGNDAKTLIAALESVGLQKGQRIVLVGAGFGWVAEEFIAQGYGPAADGTTNGKVCAVDTSTWIQNNRGANAQVSILNADVNASTGKRTIRQQFGSNTALLDWVISEDVLPILTGIDPGSNNEIIPFCQNLRTLAPNVAHWVSVLIPGSDQDQRLNWKTLADWKSWVTPDFVIQRGTSAVL